MFLLVYHTLIHISNCHFHKRYAIIHPKKAKSKPFYYEYVDFELEPPTTYRRWDLEQHASVDSYYKSLVLVKQCTNEQKLLAMQCKIIHYITKCGEHLKKWNIAKVSACQLCQKTDNVVHALYECDLTWKYITETFQFIGRINTVDTLLKVDAFVFWRR